MTNEEDSNKLSSPNKNYFTFGDASNLLGGLKAPKSPFNTKNKYKVENDGLIIRRSRHWDITFSQRLKLVGSGLSLRKSRRIVIEIRRDPSIPITPGSSRHNNNDDDLEQGGGGIELSEEGIDLNVFTSKLHDDERVFLRVLKHEKKSIFTKIRRGGRNHDDSYHDEDFDDNGGEDSDDEWQDEDVRVPFDIVLVKRIKGNKCDIQIGRTKNEIKVYNIIFDSESERRTFTGVVQHVKNLQDKRAKEQLYGYQSTIRDANINNNDKDQQHGDDDDNVIVDRSLDGAGSSSNSDRLDILVEIVSALNLPKADTVGESDPFVIVQYGSRGGEVHRTSHLPNTCNPIWTSKTGSLFILRTTEKDLFDSITGLTFVVKDYDSLSNNETLGKVHVYPKDLASSATGERIEHDLILDKKYQKKDDKSNDDNLSSSSTTSSKRSWRSRRNNKKKKKKPKNHNQAKLVLRYRPATKEDIKFMKFFLSSSHEKETIVHKTAKHAGTGFKNVFRVLGETAFHVPKRVHINYVKHEKKVTIDGQYEYRVKPGPDPDRIDETKWMTEQAIQTESLQKSRSWVEAGSGSLGYIYLEVIGCTSLPNLDSGALGDKTDAYACIVYEDCVVTTDVINDCCSPSWPSWSKRAFIFHIAHPSSQLNLAVFDYDKALLNEDDDIGRISIDVTNFNPNTEYILNYELFKSVNVTDRKAFDPNPRIKVRLRIEWHNPRAAVLASVRPAPQTYVNNAKKSDFKVTHYACHGKPDVNKFSFDTIQSHVDEIKEYENVKYTVVEALKVVLLWRGHYPVRCCGRVLVTLPLHSVVAFVGGILLVENWNLFPAFMLFCISWFMLSTMENRRHDPSPWQRCKSYGEILYMLALNRSSTKTITVNENETLIMTSNEEKRRKLDERMESEVRIQEEKEQELGTLLGEQPLEDEEFDMTTKLGLTVNPMSKLLPLQLILGKVVVSLRIIKSVITWDECMVAFWITSGCFILGVPLLFVPWGFILSWSSRIVVWLLLGPWMKLVDIFYFKKKENMTAEERRKERLESWKVLRLHHERIVREAQIRKEDAIKCKDMKIFMYGQYITAPPRHKQGRFVDCPLLSSSASPYKDDPKYRHVVTSKEKGQNLTGDMIPMPVKDIESKFLKSPKSTYQATCNSDYVLMKDDNRKA